MTDDTGMLQHATFDIPRYDDGYCLDDNARALLLMTHLEEAGTEAPARRPHARDALPRLREPRVRRVDRAVPQLPDVRADVARRRPAPTTATAARSGRWARSSGAPPIPDGEASARGSSTRALPAARALTSPRAWAYALLGIDEYLRAFEGDSSVEAMSSRARERLIDPLPRVRAAPSGRGSRTGSPTATRGCRRRCSSPRRGWATRR